MAVNDPTAGVPTPTGTLAGVAVFSWDGSTWQPAARASAGVGTPTGVLRGVAPYTWSGSAWTPAGGGPDAATPGGVLDGVAVYTWSGSAWVPPGGGPDVPTPTGTLQGIAAFYWDGTAWQPSGQAGPDVATPAGVLQGMAMFNVTATGAVPAAILDLNFMAPGALPSSVTFTRASTATYTNATGTITTAATNAPRWDYNPSTLTLNGLLIEEARTNVVLNSGDASNASWIKSNIAVVAPAVTGNQVTAPDGTLTAARVVYPAVSVAGNASILNFVGALSATAAPWTISIWARGNVGGESLYLFTTPDGVTYFRSRITLTTAWQRFSLVTGNLSTSGWSPQLGCDLRDASQTSIAAQTIFVWGGQFEAGAFATSYIPTAGATVTRSADVATIASIPGRNTSAETFQAEMIIPTAQNYASNPRIIGMANAGSDTAPIYLSTNQMSTYDGAAGSTTLNAWTIGAVTKVAANWASPTGAICLNAGTVVTGPGMTNGYAAITSIKLLGGNLAGDQTSGYIRRFRYWPRVLSNTELQQVTT